MQKFVNTDTQYDYHTLPPTLRGEGNYYNIYNYTVLLQSKKCQPEYFLLGIVLTIKTRVFYACHQEYNFLLAISFVVLYMYIIMYLNTYI